MKLGRRILSIFLTVYVPTILLNLIGMTIDHIAIRGVIQKELSFLAIRPLAHNSPYELTDI